jgi:hypothetical protein
MATGSELLLTDDQRVELRAIALAPCQLVGVSRQADAAASRGRVLQRQRPRPASHALLAPINQHGVVAPNGFHERSQGFDIEPIEVGKSGGNHDRSMP